MVPADPVNSPVENEAYAAMPRQFTLGDARDGDNRRRDRHADLVLRCRSRTDECSDDNGDSSNHAGEKRLPGSKAASRLFGL